MIQLTNRTSPLLEIFASHGNDWAMPYEHAKVYDQRPFRALLMRGWVEYSAKLHGFHATKAGREAWTVFNETEITRRNFNAPMTRYFDPVFFGLLEEKSPKKREAPGAHRRPTLVRRSQAA